ncbi:MAG: hypothetical protein AAB597_01795 [Patescibacteria group bacterium]
MAQNDIGYLEWVWLYFVIRPILFAWWWLKQSSRKGGQLAYAQTGLVPETLAHPLGDKFYEQMSWFERWRYSLGYWGQNRAPEVRDLWDYEDEEEALRECRNGRRQANEESKAKTFFIVSIFLGLVIVFALLLFVADKFGVSFPRG